MPSVMLGNVSHTSVITDPETGAKTRFRSTNIKQSTTMVNVVPDSLFEAMRDVINVWTQESDQPPAWVESDDPDLAEALRKHFHTGAKPEGWEHIITGPPASEPWVAAEPTSVPAVPETATPEEVS